MISLEGLGEVARVTRAYLIGQTDRWIGLYKSPYEYTGEASFTFLSANEATFRGYARHHFSSAGGIRVSGETARFRLPLCLFEFDPDASGSDEDTIAGWYVLEKYTDPSTVELVWSARPFPSPITVNSVATILAVWPQIIITRTP